MPNSYVEYTATGTGANQLGQKTFSFNTLDFINVNDIKIAGWNGSSWIKSGDSNLAIDTSHGTNGYDTTAKTLKILGNPSSSGVSILRLYRQTSSNALVDFVDGARLTESDLDTAYKQGLFVAQEVSEDAGAIGNTSTNNLSLIGTTTVDNLTATGTTNISGGTFTGTTNVANLTASGTINGTLGSQTTPAVYANTLGTQTIPNQTWTTVNLGTEGLDAQNNFANNAFQVPSVGIYNIQAKVTVEASVHSALTQLSVKLQKGGVDVDETTNIYFQDGDAGRTVMSLNTFYTYSGSVNDSWTLRVYGRVASGTFAILNKMASLTAFKLVS